MHQLHLIVTAESHFTAAEPRQSRYCYRLFAGTSHLLFLCWDDNVNFKNRKSRTFLV